MVESASTLEGGELSLPPKVVGRVSGYLVMKVDEVLWARKPPGEISAVVLWWGEEKPTTFRPADVSQQGSFRKHTSVIYEIRTSKDLFESYLRKCGFLKIAIADKYGMPIGCVNIPDLQQILKVSPFQNYYPIINTFGNRIGDLHVSFNLRMTSLSPAAHCKPSSPISVNVKSKKTLKRLCVSGRNKLNPYKSPEKTGEGTTKQVSMMKTLPTKKKPRPKTGNSLNDQSTSTSSLDGKKQFGESFVECVPNRGSKNTENMISQILEHGKKIRDAMAHAVIEDHIGPECEILTERTLCKNLENPVEVISSHNTKVGASNVEEYVNGMRRGRQEISTDKEKKILDFLAGKPMTESEENEAVEALRNTTPSKDVLNKVDEAVETNLKLSSHFCESEKDLSKESPEIVAPVADATTCKQDSELQGSFDLDAELLSRVNCLRITIDSLVLNSVGLKRIGSSSACQKKKAKSHSSTQLPPGVTYFVEYQLPTASVSRSHMSGVVRYCSKRQVGCEVNFGDRSVHNIPALQRSSLSEHSALVSFILSLTFKVCARHLNQRVPILLGSATPNSAMFLLGSAHLRHKYELPVISCDHLPVANLKVCLELGRDRIHFGGIFDPENNSLGIASVKGSQESLKSMNNIQSRKSQRKIYHKQTPSVLVTRNVSKPLTPGEAAWKGKILFPHTESANRETNHRMEDGRKDVKKFSSAPSSAISTQRSNSSSIPSQFLSSQKQDSAFCPSKLQSINDDKPSRNCLKHELAITIQQICGCLPLDGTVNDDRDCFVSYKFPSWDASVDAIVEWNSFSTEPTVCLQDTWFRPQCRVHGIVLPDTISLHVFLRESFRMRGIQSSADSTVVFSICVRYYGERVKDSLLAQAFLPYGSLVALENAYNSAANGDPRFSESSCASVMIDLPLHFSPAYKTFGSNGYLKIKLDYRQVHGIQLVRGTNVPQSHGDSLSNISRNVSTDEAMNHIDINPSRDTHHNYFDNTVPVPKWAQTPDKLCSPWEDAAVYKSYPCGKEGLNVQITDPPDAPSRGPSGILASWEPVSRGRFKTVDTSMKYESERQHTSRSCFREENASHRSVIDLLHADDEKSDVALSYGSNKLSSVPLSTHSFSCNDLYLNGGNDYPVSNRYNLSNDETLCAINLGIDARQKESYDHDAEKQTQSYSRAVDKSTSPLHPDRHNNECDTSSRLRCATFKHASVATDNICLETTVKSCQTSPRHTIVESGLEESAPASEETVNDIGVVHEVVDSETNVQDLLLETSVVDTSDQKLELEESGNTASSGEEKGIGKMPQFSAKIGVECAFHLQSSVIDEDSSLIFVSCHPCETSTLSEEEVSSPSEVQTMYVSPSVTFKSDPEWCWNCLIHLPVDLLVSVVRRLVFKLWQRRSSYSDKESNPCHLIGFAAVDLTVLAAGLPLVSGWFNIMDFAGKCRGQIKLSVEPTEDISEYINLTDSLGESRADPTKVPSSSMYFAHCAYPKFPSHVVLDGDMRIHMVETQPPDEVLSAGYQMLLQHCTQPAASTAAGNPSETVITLERTPELHNIKCHGAGERAAPLAQQTDPDEEEDPSIRLRKKMSELDFLNKMMKAQLMINAESCHTNSSVASHTLPCDPMNRREKKIKHNVSCGSVGAAIETEQKKDSEKFPKSENKLNVIVRNTNAETQTTLTEENLLTDVTRTCAPQTLSASEASADLASGRCWHNMHDFNLCYGINCEGRIPCEANHGPEAEVRNTLKPRKTWGKQEDFIDLRSLELDCKEEEEEIAQIEEVAKWLSNSAINHIFNPVLFHDLLNDLSPTTSSVKVIELDEDSNNESHFGSSNDEAKKTSWSCECSSENNSKHFSKDNKRAQDYRKNVAHCFTSESQDPGGRCFSSTVDTDSGVDVDSSAVFQSVVSTDGFGVGNSCSRRRKLAQHTGHGTTRSKSGLISSASNSEVSTLHHSSGTGPSSLSATPSGSPKRGRPAPEFP